MKWINFLHFYLPPTSSEEIVKKVAKESYSFLNNTYLNNKNAKVTININGILLEQLEKFKQENIIKDIKKLIEQKKVEIVGSTYFHPVLPLLPKNEIVRNIKMQEQALNHYFSIKKPAGFFIPEMLYDKKLSKIIESFGYKWLILDQIAFNGKLENNFVYGKKYQLKNSKLKLVFRSRKASKSFVPQYLLDLITKANPPKIMITATDAELYGHFHQDVNNLLKKTLNNKNIKTITISEFLSQLSGNIETVEPVACSWESTEQELKNKKPYILWNNPKNNIQKNIWQLTKIALKYINEKKNDPNKDWARYHFNRGISSCVYWWASGKDFRLFAPPAWNPDEIIKGTEQLIKSIRSLNALEKDKKIIAEKLYSKINRLIWIKHWKKYA